MQLTYSPTHKSIHILQPLQANSQTKAAKRVCFFPTQEKLKNKKISTLQKNKVLPPHNPRQTILDTDERRASANKVLPQWGVKCFYETFVRKRTVVLLLNICAKIPHCGNTRNVVRNRLLLSC